MPFEVIDGYSHCGVSKYRPIEDVKRIMVRYGVGRAVLVQHLGEFDNSYMEQIVSREPDRFAGVLVVDTEDADADRHLRYWTRNRSFRGIRLLAHTLRTNRPIWDQAAEAGLNIVVYDEPTLAHFANLLQDFAVSHESTPVVLSHLGVVDPDEAPRFTSQLRIADLCELSNVYIQVSGMHMFGEAPYERLVPLIEHFFEKFGVERLYYGSNYSVVDEELYGAEIELLRVGKLGIAPEAVETVLRATAMKLWFETNAS